MTTYTPDSWVPVLINSKEHGKIYKVLASWYGGFAGADTWKLSSGIESISISEDGTVITMPQSSGSTYVVGRRTHMSSLMHSVFTDFEHKSRDSGLFTITVIPVSELFEAFK